MQFCPKCGNLLVAEIKNGKRRYVCSKCGYIVRSKKVSSTDISEKINHDDEKILIFDEKKNLSNILKQKLYVQNVETLKPTGICNKLEVETNHKQNS